MDAAEHPSGTETRKAGPPAISGPAPGGFSGGVPILCEHQQGIG